MKRLFFALWPDAKTRMSCAEVIAKLANSGGKPVRADNLHVTLLFLGGVDADQEQAITTAAAAIPIYEMKLLFDELCFWQKPAIYCLTTQQTDGAVSELNLQLQAIARQAGIKLDERPFKPHITLQRKVHVPAVLKFSPILCQSAGFCLVESCPDKAGANYKVINRFNTTS